MFIYSNQYTYAGDINTYYCMLLNFVIVCYAALLWQQLVDIAITAN